MRRLALGLIFLLASCATGSDRLATEVEPNTPVSFLGDSLAVLSFENHNFEEAVVSLSTPSGRSIRLGWVPGYQTKAWVFTMRQSGNVRLHIRLLDFHGTTSLDGQNKRSVVECRSSLNMSPGSYWKLDIFHPNEENTQSMCPGGSP